MLSLVPTPLVRLSNLFPHRQVYAKCEHLGLGGSFKIRGAVHLLDSLSQGKKPALIVPSMGNTALGMAVGAKVYGFSMIGVVPQNITRAKDEKLQALGVELVKVAGGGTDLLRHATEIAAERGGYFLHPHLDANWTDGYQPIVAEIAQELPDCRALVFPVGGGGLLMGITEYLLRHPAAIKLIGCEAYNYPTYARFDHARTPTIADGLILEVPHPKVSERIQAMGIDIHMVKDPDIRTALIELYNTQGMIVEPSSVVTTAFVKAHETVLEEPVCVILTGENIAREDFYQRISQGATG